MQRRGFMEYMNSGVGVSTPFLDDINETKVSTPKKRKNGTAPKGIHFDKVPAPKYLNNDKENELKKIGNSDFLIKLTKVKQAYLYFKERTKDVEQDFIEQIRYSAKKLKGKK